MTAFAYADTTRTTRMSAFWGYSLQPHDYPYCWFILGPKSKQDKVKVTILKNLPKLPIFHLKTTLHMTRLLKFLDKMCKSEMDLASVVEDTEGTWFCPHKDRRTERQTRWNQYTPLSTSLKQGLWWNCWSLQLIINRKSCIHLVYLFQNNKKLNFIFD